MSELEARSAEAPFDPVRRRLIQSAASLGGVLLFGQEPPESAMYGIQPMTHAQATVERIRFTSAGETLIGLLCLPAGSPVARAGIVLLGPFGFVKEQSPVEYATRLANAGFVALIFDPRGSGESGGSPRRHESPANKIADASAALNYLATRPEVDTQRLGALGICQGCSEMIALAAAESRIRALALVSGQYLYAQNIAKFFSGGGPDLGQRIARGREARIRYDTTGQVEYNEVVSLTNKSAGLPWPPIHDWYMPWTTDKWGAPSRWENRYTTMSDAEVWAFDVDAHARKLHTPTLIVHGEMSDGGTEAAEHVYGLVPTGDKQLHIVPGVFHTRFYDDPLVIEPTFAMVVGWLQRHLGST